MLSMWGQFSRIGHWSTSSGQGQTAGTTVTLRVDDVTCLVRCCFSRMIHADDLTRSVDNCAFSVI